jgi:magnesium-transporting ATPase (P-type)
VLMDHHSSEESEEEDRGEKHPKSEGFSKRMSSSLVDTIPPPPNRGLVCFVLRTGFNTVQGQLLRTMAYHAEAGGGGNGGGGDGVNAMETLYFLLILLLCALCSAATVVEHAWGDVTRNHFKLVLHVVIIITSVIPPELPSESSILSYEFERLSSNK